MSFIVSSEQADLQSAVRSFLAGAVPEAEVRRLMAGERGFEDAVWMRMAGELELCGLALPESLGGSGYSFIEVGLVLEELGAALAPLPYFSSVVLAQGLVLAAGDGDAATRWLPSLGDGSLRGTVWLPAPGRAPESWPAATPGTDGWTLSGSCGPVIDGVSADVVFLPAQKPGGSIGWFAVEAGAAGLTATNLDAFDPTRKLGRLDFTASPVIGIEGDGEATLSAVRDLAAAGLAAECIGGMRRVLEMSVVYAKSRTQFGRTIGSFQAIKHLCADMYVSTELARAVAYHALAAAVGGQDLPAAASLAVAYCPDAYFAAADDMVHIHGGIGVTWEHPAQLYFRRARASQLLLGESRGHLLAFADRIGL